MSTSAQKRLLCSSVFTVIFLFLLAFIPQLLAMYGWKVVALFGCQMVYTCAVILF